MNILFNLFSSVIIPGIIWDILKTGSEYSLKNIIEKFSKWNISDKEAEEIKQLIDDLKLKKISSKKELKFFLRRYNICKLNIKLKKRYNHSIHTKGDNNIYNFNITNISLKYIISFLIFIIIVFAIFILLYIFIKPKTSENAEFTNKYVFGTYDGLIKKNNTTTSFQKMDTEFYFSENERKKGNYIRILQYSTYNDLSKTKWDELKDIYESILISLCSQYNNSDLKIKKEEFSKSWEFMNNKKGVYLDIHDRYSSNIDFYNTVIFKYMGGFIMQRCLYFGEHDIIVVILSCCEKDYKMLNNVENGNLLIKCFESFKQIYNENSSVYITYDE